jgi:hypothetical protein
MRPSGTVWRQTRTPVIDRGLGLEQRCERARVVKQLTPERLMKRSIFPVVVGERGSTQDQHASATRRQRLVPKLDRPSGACSPYPTPGARNPVNAAPRADVRRACRHDRAQRSACAVELARVEVQHGAVAASERARGR